MRPFNTLLLFIVLFLPTRLPAQTIDLGRCSADGLSKKGLHELKKIIGDARIVVIGEQVHGVGTDYENFAFLTQFLHEEMNFNVILQEFCFHHFGKVQVAREMGEPAQTYRYGMYWPQAKAIENDLLLDYIDAQNKTERPLYMEGFDPRIFRRDEFYAYCDSLLTTLGKNIMPVKMSESFLVILNKVLKYEYKDTLTTKEEKRFFLSTTGDIINLLESYSFHERTIQTFRSLFAYARNAWNLNGIPNNYPNRFLERENMMAQNIFWFLDEKYPNEKIIIRMHNGHAAKNTHVLKGCIPDSLTREAKNVGSQLFDKYGNQCVFIGSTYYSGTYCGWDYKAKTIPTPKPTSIEQSLHQRGYKYAYIDIRKTKPFPMFFNEFNSWVEDGFIQADFGKLFDGIIYIDQVKMPTEVPTESMEK